MYNPNYDFCEELDCPEMCLIMNRIWWINNSKDILDFLGEPISIVQRDFLYIPNEADRTYFMLRWPQ
jgi:hypothetical protein